MGHLYQPHGCLLTHIYSSPVAKISQVLPQRHHLPVYQPTLWPRHGPTDFQQHGQGSQIVGLTTRNPYSSIPGLADSRPFQRRVTQTDSKTVKVSEAFGLGSESQEIRTGTLPEIRLPRVPFFTRFGTCQAHSRQVDKIAGDVPLPLLKVCYQCNVHHWITCINGEDGQTGQNAYETFSVASQDSLQISDASGHTNPLESEDDTTWGMVIRPPKCATRRVSPPKGTQKTDLYRALKRKMGHTL